MFPLLHQYLIDRSSVELPGIGTLQFTAVPARFDVTHRQLFPTAQQLNLVAGNGGADQPHLIGFLAKRLEVSETQAHTLFQHFLNWLENTVSAQGAVQWKHMGSFQKDKNGAISFVQSPDLEQYQPPVNAAESGVRQHSNYAVLVGGDETTSLVMEQQLGEHKKAHQTYWWVWALVIGLAAAVVIALKYNGKL